MRYIKHLLKCLKKVSCSPISVTHPHTHTHVCKEMLRMSNRNAQSPNIFQLLINILRKWWIKIKSTIVNNKYLLHMRNIITHQNVWDLVICWDDCSQSLFLTVLLTVLQCPLTHFLAKCTAYSRMFTCSVKFYCFIFKENFTWGLIHSMFWL